LPALGTLLGGVVVERCLTRGWGVVTSVLHCECVMSDLTSVRFISMPCSSILSTHSSTKCPDVFRWSIFSSMG